MPCPYLELHILLNISWLTYHLYTNDVTELQWVFPPLQSSVCMKQLAFDLLELLLLTAFPELDYVFRQLHEEKHKFGEFKPN
jgi:hypothetical protein